MSTVLDTLPKPGVLGGLKRRLTHRAGLARSIVVFALVVIVGTVVGLQFVLQEDLIFPWQHSTSYYAVFNDASAIAPGQHQEVRVAGVRVGDIGTASVTRGGDARVQLQITDRSVTLYRNATVLLQAKTPLNEMYMQLNPGTPDAGVLPKGGTIPLAQTTSPVEVDQILQHLGPEEQTAVQVLLEQTIPALRDASNYLPADLASLNTTAGDLTPVVSALATRRQEIATLVTDLQQVAGAVGGNQQQLATLLGAARSTLGTLQANDASLSKALADLPGTTSALGGSLQKVQALTAQVNPLLDNLRNSSTVLPKAIGTLTTTVNQLHPVLDQLGPVVTEANPVVGSLQGYLGSADPTLADVKTISPDLSPVTSYVQYDMPWLKGFFYNTASLSSVYDGNEPVVRSLVVAGAPTLAGFACSLGLPLPAFLSGATSGKGC